MQASPINPFYAARTSRVPAPTSATATAPVYARLPLAPRNASPVPHLTSLYHFHRAGEYGNRSYPGNCGGRLIRDLLLFFRSKNAFDPCSGSGTCADVCREIGIPCLSRDIRHGFDATDADCFRSLPEDSSFDFIWAHPPYFRQKIYSDNPRDLSRLPTVTAFLERYCAFIRNCAGVLSPGGKFAILMGDYCDREAGFLSLTYHTKQLAFAAGLRQSCTDIIRFSHGHRAAAKFTTAALSPAYTTCAWCWRKRPRSREGLAYGTQSPPTTYCGKNQLGYYKIAESAIFLHTGLHIHVHGAIIHK